MAIGPGEKSQRTGINLATDDQLCFTNACFHDGAVLGVIVHHEVLAVFDEFSRSRIPLIRDQ